MRIKRNKYQKTVTRFPETFQLGTEVYTAMNSKHKDSIITQYLLDCESKRNEYHNSKDFKVMMKEFSESISRIG